MTHDTATRRSTAHLAAGLLPVLLACVAIPVAEAAEIPPRALTLEERVAAQRAIEQVYWDHRIWPKENPGPKPPLSVVLSDAAIRDRVEDSLRKSNALEKYWHRAITADHLQAEMNRMAAQTRDPQLLHELFAALGNDPDLIAETLARRTLSDRLVRNWYADDERFHGDQKKKAEAALSTCRNPGCMPSMGGEYLETTWKLVRRAANPNDGEDSRPLQDDAWQPLLKRLARSLGAHADSLPIAKLTGLEETEDGFEVTAVLRQGREEIQIATARWPKTPFDTWWATVRATLTSEVETRPQRLALPSLSSHGCTADTWYAIEPALQEAESNTTVWTGTEMIVWGGLADGYGLNRGGRYNPATDTWMPTSTGASVPEARWGHAAVWTGTEMIVWGGSSDVDFPSLGGRYNPTTDTWRPTSTGANLPEPRWDPIGVWTGTEMIVWGGMDGMEELNTGGRYNPATDTWLSTSTGANVPGPRYFHVAVWTGSEMIVWGGVNNTLGGYLSGGRYDPSSDTWTPTSTGTDVPAARWSHTAVWTGSEMIVWGGVDGGFQLNTGGRYHPSTDTWTPTSTGPDVPEARNAHTAAWTGTEMLVWGGDASGVFLNTGGRYNPSTDSWLPISVGMNAPSPRVGPATVWTGMEMIIWGGRGEVDGNPISLKSGGRYDPSDDSWTATSQGPFIPAARAGHTALWTGAEMIIWGGGNTGGRYDPSTSTWTPTSTGVNVPAPRISHTAVWTGTEMIAWGGQEYTSILNTGGRYNPTTDTWTPTSIGSNVPAARTLHTAVWTGSEMIVWGGHHDWTDIGLNTGGRYNPSTDSWITTSTGPTVPAGRFFHTAVWTGTEMIVWGGRPDDSGGYLNTGGRYTPATDTWTSTSTDALLAARYAHTAVWTDSEMIVWGGTEEIPYCVTYDEYGTCIEWGYYESPFDTGARYEPSGDTWTPMSTGSNLPAARFFHGAVWTGREMIVWGGQNGTQVLDSGGRYDPSSDTWTPTSTGADLPDARQQHTSVWTGTEMIVWGGQRFGGVMNTGGLYCACPAGTLYYLDSDGDGFGDPGVMGSSCDGTIPPGYIADSGDCNDTNPSVHPGVPELCNGVDDECDGTIDNAAPPGPLDSLTLRSDEPAIAWDPGPPTEVYDVVYGSLGGLLSSAGDFTAATQGCLAQSTAETSATFSASPAVGEGFWIAVRGNNCAGSGTYDSGDPGQVGSRDSEVNASPYSCGHPSLRGDGQDGRSARAVNLRNE